MQRAIEKEFSHYEIVEVFEEQKSGFIPYRREKFDRMIQMIGDGEAQGIITWKMSRLSRNPEESGIIMGMLQRGEIAHIYTSDRSYLPGDNILISAFEFAMSNQSSLDTSKDTKRGINEKAERGWSPHSTLPIGYQHVEYLQVGIDPEILPDTERFGLFQRGVMQIIEGKLAPKEAHKWLKDEGLRQKKTRTKPERVMPWSTFYRLLGDRFYVGEFELNGKVYQGKHKPMFTEDEFDRLQDILGRKDRPRPKTHFFPFSGLIKCGKCGCSIIADPTNKKLKNGGTRHYVHYHCTKKRGNCDQKTINVDKLEEQFETLLENIEIPESFHRWAIDQLRNEHSEEIEQRQLTQKRNRELYDEAQTKLDRLVDMRLSDLISEADFKVKKESIEREKKTLKELVDNSDNRQSEWIDIMEKAMEFAKTARDRFEHGSPQVKKEIMFNLGSNFVLFDRIVKLDLDSPLRLVEKVAKDARELDSTLELSRKLDNKEEIVLAYASNPKWGR